MSVSSFQSNGHNSARDVLPSSKLSKKARRLAGRSADKARLTAKGAVLERAPFADLSPETIAAQAGGWSMLRPVRLCRRSI